MNEQLMKILIIGDGNVGKSSFVHRYVNGQFNKTYKMTVGGQERFISMTRIYYKGALGCVVMFDVTSSSSFLSCRQWKQDLDNKAMLSNGNTIPCVLLANKCDLSQRVVSADSIDRFSKANGFITWMEISVKENKNIGEAMRRATQNESSLVKFEILHLLPHPLIPASTVSISLQGHEICYLVLVPEGALSLFTISPLPTIRHMCSFVMTL
ncbi:ras-related protein Rab-7L1-like isoform X2 [Channa argus]|uniref:ras-related protein Rab-7L1-like isoform X2 n=1 Tax=Channa argus TaxID=215402 RepID=UPI00352220D6